VNDLVLTLYSKGMTMRDITDVLKEFFGEDISPSKVNDLAKSFAEVREIWKNSKLSEYYKMEYCDAIGRL